MSTGIPYQYKNLPIPGGGYVTGFLFSKKYPDTLYIRTDIGGTYRYQYDSQKWAPLNTDVTMFDLSETYPSAIALDDNHPDRLFIISGVHDRACGLLSISEDRGKTFIRKPIPTLVHGNWSGRGTGYRLVSDPLADDTLYYASQKGGLLRTTDMGNTWEELSVNNEKLMTLVWISPDGNTIVTGCAGATHISGHMRGHSLYVSYDRGASFEKLPMPENIDFATSKLSGLVAQRADYDGTYLYITCAVTGKRAFILESSYSCDTGDVLGGRVLRYSFDANGKISQYTDITPYAVNTTGNISAKVTTGLSGTVACPYSLADNPAFLEYGFSGITSATNVNGSARPGMIACSTICKDDGDMIFVSYDYGNTWEAKLYDLSIGLMDFKTPYMRPCCNGGHNLVHWLSDLKFNPFNPDEIWFNSGTGVFVSHNFTDKTAVFSDCCGGIEETVHLNIYGMPAGEVQVIDIVGDLGAFAFRDLNAPCDNSFADENGNRYITCINADFSDITPETVIVTPRGNWTGRTKGGLIISYDQCRTFTRLPMPFGLSRRTDALLERIEHPNVNSGWVAMSPDCQNIVWSVAERLLLPIDAVLHSHDGGQTFALSKINGITGETPLMKVYADRVNSNLMYGFGEASQFYISKDGGATFDRYNTPADFPMVNFGKIDCSNKTEIRAESGKEGLLYIATGEHGLYKMVYDSISDTLSLTKISKEGDIIYRFGLGLLRPDGDYITEDKAFYISGIINGDYGFYRSLDQGKTWLKLNTPSQMYGEINSIDGDCRTFGRFYIATGSFGALYGEEAVAK